MLELDLHRLFAYEFWANREALASLQRAGAHAPPRAVQIMAHIIAASRLWLTRLTGERANVEVWPTGDLDQISRDMDALELEWRKWLSARETVVPNENETVSYVNSKGEPWSSTWCDILTHLLLHSSYHRGQIATLMGQANQAGAYTDYIHAVRQGLL